MGAPVEPVRPAEVTRAQAIGTQVVYELVQSNEFPAVDLTRTTGSAFSPVRAWSNACANAVSPLPQDLNSSKMQFEVSRPSLFEYGIAVGLGLAAAVYCVPAAYGAPLAVAATVVSLPGQIRMLSLTRLDIARMAVESYEFWYYVTINSAVCGLIAAYFNDTRAILFVTIWFGVVNAAVVDAKTVDILASIYSSVGTASVHLLAALLIQFGQVSNPRHFAVLHYRDHVLVVEDLIVNGLATSTLILLRNAYRRHKDLRQQRLLRCSMLRCVNYRCTLKLQRVDSGGLDDVEPGADCRAPNYQKYKHTFNVILHIDTGALYDASKTFYPVELTEDPWPRRQRWLLLGTALLGIALTVLGFAVAASRPGSSATMILAAGLVLTVCFCAIAWAMLQVKLLRELLLSFDFVFLSLQLSSAHLCVCDMFSWDARCLGLLSSWLWMHFVLTADALTPAVRAKLRFRHWYLGVLVLLFTLGQVLLAFEIVFSNRWDLRDRRIHAISIGDFIIEYRVITFFFNRLVTIFLWTLRLLWRIAMAHPDDVLMLRGKVGYAYFTDPSHMGKPLVKTPGHNGATGANKTPHLKTNSLSLHCSAWCTRLCADAAAVGGRRCGVPSFAWMSVESGDTWPVELTSSWLLASNTGSGVVESLRIDAHLANTARST